MWLQVSLLARLPVCCYRGSLGNRWKTCNFQMFNKVRNFHGLNGGVGRILHPNVPLVKANIRCPVPLPSLLGRHVCIRFCKTVAKSAQQSKPKSKDLKRLMNLASPEKARIAGAITLLLVSSSVSMAVPFAIGTVINMIYSEHESPDKMVEKLTKFCSILLGVFAIGAAANFGRVYLMNTAGNRIVKTLREKLYSSILKQEVAFFDKTRTGELLNRLSTDTSLVGQSLTQNISDGLRSTIQAIGGFSMMLYVSAKLTMVSLLIIPPVAGVSIVYGRYLKKLTKQVQDTLAESTQIAEEKLGNIRTVRAFGQEMKEMQLYDKKVTEVLKLTYKEALARGAFWAFSGLSGNIIVLSVFYHGGMMMGGSQISVGELTSFLLYAAYIGVSIGGLSSFYSELMRGLGASSRLWDLIDRVPSIPLIGPGGGNALQQMSGKVQFQNINFSYPSRSDISVLNGFDLTVPQGHSVALVGPSGSGKSTVAAMLLRFYDPNSGSIRIDGQDLDKLDPLWVRNNVGYVSQEPMLFSTSIGENISYGGEDTSAEEIIEAAKKANAWRFIQSFPEGLDTLVGERGVQLSGGQKQRIAIARAVLRNPKILILDEATSALDVESERLVQAALDTVMKDRTVIIIAHRLSTIKHADQVAVLDGGKIVEYGTYQDLVTSNGRFKELVKQQAIVVS